MSKTKNKHAFWLTPEAKREAESCFQDAGCQNQSEFVEKAIRFYSGYIHSKNDAAFVPTTLADIMEGTVGIIADRIGKLLFKQSVELGVLSHIIAADTDLDQVTLKKLRSMCVDDVNRTNGQIEFKDILKFQREA